ncbi:MAG: hypothetical protein JNL02_20430 [Saprospiraceae bacterium]|nr:hypothetical protein [Saprospiraceae bacterium]
MFRNYPLFLIAALLLLSPDQSRGQGCSDAGFCTLNSFKPDAGTPAAANQIKIGGSFGGADNAISVVGGYLEYNRQFGDKFGLDAKLTALGQSGNDISAFGLSDLYVNANLSPRSDLHFTLGAKIPLADGNAANDNLPLPMDYQASLGTFDLIVGAGYDIGKLQLVVALQQPLTQNKNAFFAEDYPAGSPLRDIQTTNMFQRSGDVLLRVSYPFQLGQKLTLTPSLLPIYHLANDKFTDKQGNEIEIDGSQGLTFNGNLYFDYAISASSALQLNAGLPFVVRDARPDGLTRSFVANLEYRFKF